MIPNRPPDRKSSNFKLYDRPKGKANKMAKKSRCNKSVAGMSAPDAEYVVNTKATQHGLCFGETRRLPVAKGENK